ncbi:hypothetical protein U2T78_000760 [Providencia stuartii]|uniref:Uncharacterized protein n=4 Tax=Providencia stuartii TaxID=588 RepID=A0AAJ1JEZ2_PROST|nr:MULTISPECIES: hypothetical protein [Providencia]EMA3640113.1 hypothetical protein [Providencia stuartii]MBW3102261.1 hypothetical protein [Providencia stuartii]MCB5216041.1 hypothetical protein [Providencia stuartii]MDE8750621.1 hypothetical protein [Providencia thailandensis]MDE8769881.1 hypothetical protein [Providencia thailandensis]
MGIVAFVKKHMTLKSSFDRAKKQSFVSNHERYQNNVEPEELTFIDEINAKQFAIANVNRGKRDVGAMSFFLVILVCFIVILSALINRNIKSYNTFVSTISMYEKHYNLSKEKNILLTKQVKELRPFYGEGNKSFGVFFVDYYLWGGHVNKVGGMDVAFIIFTLILGVFTGMTGYIIFLSPLPVLIFDREKKYVYSYLKGKVSADRYEYIEYGHAPIMLAVRLYSINTENGELQEEMFLPYTSAKSNLNFNTANEANIFVSFVNTFMREGREAVMDSDYKQPKPLLLLSRNKLPKDFEAQIEAILIKRDEEKALNA